MKNLPQNQKPKTSEIAQTSTDKPIYQLEHCVEGDPCERVIDLRPDGTLWVNALCGEILPVIQSIEPRLKDADFNG